MKTYLLLLSVMASCVLFSSGSTLADEAKERALAAENKMLRAAVDTLRAEITKLKAEIKQLKEPSKPATTVDANSGKAVASPTTQPASAKGNDILAKALLKYIAADKTTSAKQEKADASFRKESRVTISVEYVVTNIETLDNTFASVSLSDGVLKTSVETTEPILITGMGRLDLRMSPNAAAKVDKGSKVIVTGDIEATLDGHAYKIDTLANLDHGRLRKMVTIIKTAITLNGKSIEFAK
jgi:hypothetical protein